LLEEGGSHVLSTHVGVEQLTDHRRCPEYASSRTQSDWAALVAAVFPAAVAVMLGALYLAKPGDSSIAEGGSSGEGIAIVVVACLAATAGRNGLVLFCVGLSVTIGTTRIGEVPLSLILILGIAVGTLGRSLGKRKVVEVYWPLLGVACFVAAYAVVRPAATTAGAVAAYGLVILPAGLVVLRMSLAAGRAERSEMAWLAAGFALAVGAGLIQAYGTVTSDYASYTRVRVFESVIGSSNYAAALAVIPGLLLLALGLRPPKRSPLLVVLSAPFLVAPLLLASRGAVVAMACGAVVLTLRPGSSRSAGRLVRIGVALVAALAVAVIAARQGWYVWQRFDSGSIGGDYLAGRSRLWEFTLSEIESHPVGGLGPGRLADALMAYYGKAYAHQFYLGALAQLGLLVGSAYLWVIRPQPIRTWSPALPAIVAIAVNSAVEPVLSTPTGAVLFVGLGAAHWAHGRLPSVG
jgi:hypothetical protein